MNAYPAYTTKPEPANHRCPMGFAPSGNGSEPTCMFCEHSVRSTCHLDFGTDRCGGRIISRSTTPGERLPIRYAHQTYIYAGWGWLDLVAVRDQLAEALADPEALHRVASRLVDLLPKER